MKFLKRAYLFLFILAATLVVGCEPSVTVQNTTTFPVRMIVTSPNGKAALSPSPGESSTAEVAEGAYSVAIVLDDKWIEYAKLVRKDLNEQLANSDKLTGPQLFDVIRRLKEIAARMDQFQQTAGKGASCSGSITEEGGGLVTISTAPDGKLIASCK